MALLEENPALDSAGVEDVVLMGAGASSLVVGPALLVELTLENETEVVVAALEVWLPSRLLKAMLASECASSLDAAPLPLPKPRVRQLKGLSLMPPRAAAPVRASAVTFVRPTAGPACQQQQQHQQQQQPQQQQQLQQQQQQHRLIRLTMKMGGSHGTGSRLWEGGVLLATWLLHESCLQPPGPVANLRVLELGAGFCGLPSRIAAHVGALRVTATEGVSEVFQLLLENVRNCDVRAKMLRWGEDEIADEDAPDVLLFADCVYTEAGASLLLECVAMCQRLQPRLVVHGTLEPEARFGCQEFAEGMVRLGFVASREVLSSELLAADRQQLPPSSSEEIDCVQLWTWRADTRSPPA